MRETNRHILSQTSQPASGRESPLDRARRRASVAVRQRPTSATSQSRPARPGERRAAPAPVALAPLSDAEQRELKAILAEPMDYIDHAEYHAAEAEARIYGAAEIARPDVTWYRPLMDDFISARHRQPRSAKSQTTILLTGAQERVLFMKYNFARFSVSEIQKRAANRALTLEEAREVLRWHRTATAYREQIAETNLALVLAMAKRVRISEVDFADLISEGNMALMRSVDKFDCGRGFKFSTYACRAILKAFSRHGIKVTTHIRRFGAEYDPILEKSNHLETVRATHERDCADEVKFIVASNKAELSEIELKVIGHRFGLGSALDSLVATGVPAAPVSTDSLTLEQVGQMIGVTKERVRQIQNKALEKIRAALESANPAAAGDMAADIAAREGRTIPSAN